MACLGYRIFAGEAKNILGSTNRTIWSVVLSTGDKIERFNVDP
jgi:hypothetical protein